MRFVVSVIINYNRRDSDKVDCKLEIVLEFSDEAVAKKVLDSVTQDNGEWISTRQDCNRLFCSASSESIGGLLHTAEDFLSCVVLAEKMIRDR